jgi:hypothetical protein
MLLLPMTISSKETMKMPNKKKADTSWITEDLIDALAWTESKHKNTPETA